VPAADLFETELYERLLAEDRDTRAARRANQRWITMVRLWAAMDREGVVEDGDRARFICERLWPDLRHEVVEQVVEHTRARTATGAPLPRPSRARDVVGDELERLMAEHGYDTGA
jgi:hypothetical protein